MARPARPWHGEERIVATVDSSTDSLYSVRDVADQLGVHPETIRRLIHDGRLDAVRIGRVLRVHGDSLQGFLARQRVKPTRLSI
jgi:excisionase family DNA binding protein